MANVTPILRPINQDELERVHTLISEFSGNRCLFTLLMFVTGIFITAVTLLAGSALGAISAAPDMLVWFIILVVTVPVSLLILRFVITGYDRLIERLSREQGPYAEDIQDGQVAVYHLQATSAAFLKTYYGDVRAILMQIGPDEMLYLMGPYVEDLVKADKFPCKKFNLIRLPHSGKIIKLECKSKPFAYTAIPSISFTALTALDGEVITGVSLDELARRHAVNDQTS